MTNINQINEPGRSLTVPNTKDIKNGGAESFESALNKAFDKPQTTESNTISEKGLNEIISPAPAPNIIKPSDIISGKTDNLLKMLDSYSSKLENPDVSLKSIGPVLEEIKKTAGHLLKETQSLSHTDEGLKKIATQAAVMAQTEYTKFQRGDYLS